MVGEGARPLKQDYCIASDSHFNKGKLSQSVLAVCVSWSHSMHSLACHVWLLFNAKLELRISRLACTQVTPCYSEYPD